MPLKIQILMFGSLREEEGNLHRHLSGLSLKDPIPLRELLNHLHLLPGRVQMVLVNHRAVPLDHVVQAGDRIAIFPKEYPLFADWKDFRS